MTVPVPGAWGTQGTGGTGASGDGVPASSGPSADVVVSDGITINLPMNGLDGGVGTNGTNFATGGNGGNTGIYYSGLDIYVAAAIIGGAGGQGGSALGGVG
ncbi:hypothetical protein EIL82_15710, partial [Pandoraea apista]